MAENEIIALEHSDLYRFADWPNEDLRISAPGVYTVWRNGQFLYVGISWQDRPGSRGLFGRLDQHAAGRRSGDQFCLYVCDRFIVPELSNEQLRGVGDGSVSLDRLTRDFIRSELEYRAVHTESGTQARSIEAAVRREGLPGYGLPMLNPRR